MEEMMVNISVVIPVYNLQNYIHNPINSLLSQTDYNFELVIVNDGSTDNSEHVIEKLLEENHFTNYRLINTKNSGVSSARNRGFLESFGDYIYFLDGDDYITDDFVDTVKYFVDREKPDILAWGFDLVDENKRIVRKYFDNYNSNLASMTGLEALQRILFEPKDLWIWTSSALYKKTFLLENGIIYTEGCSNGEDQEFTFKALAVADKVFFLDRTLSFYVQRTGSITNSFSMKRFDVINAMERAAVFIYENSEHEGLEIANSLNYQKSISNYFYSLDAYIKFSRSNEDRITIKNAIQVLKKIDEEYPGLTKNIKSKMKFGMRMKAKERIKHSVFIIHPVVYIKVIDYYWKLVLFITK